MPNQILVVNQTLGTVFPAKPDLAGPKGDTKGRGCLKSPRASKGRDPPCDNHRDSRTEEKEQHHISYSVSYFNYTVSTSEDECDNVTISLIRLKIRRSSRERNDKNLKDKDRQA